jgi:chorismate dehydratase
MIPYLNSVPFYRNFEKSAGTSFKILPVTPRRMGLLSDKGQLTAGLFSLMDYYRQEDRLELLNWCIATRDQVKSVMLFSKEGWLDLNSKRVGITDDTATSVRLLQVLLEKKYGVHATFERLHAGVNEYSAYDAILLIGDEALYRNKYGLEGFELVFDLAKEWYDWKKLPFVFAVWAANKSTDEKTKQNLRETIERSLAESEEHFGEIGELSGKRIGLTVAEVEEYLQGFNYRLGEREREAMKEFHSLTQSVNSGLTRRSQNA